MELLACAELMDEGSSVRKEERTLRSKTALPCRITDSFSWPTQLQPRCGFACTGCAALSLSSSGMSKNFLLCAIVILAGRFVKTESSESSASDSPT
jgi:hypothetical protein